MLPGLRSAIGHFLFVSRALEGDRGGPWRGFQVQRRPALGPRELEWASGGGLLLRPQAVRDVEGFDPGYFLYAEDVDLGRRLMAAGWETWLLPSATVHHSVAASSGGVSDRWFRALHDDYAQHSDRVRASLFDLIAGTGLLLRAVAVRGDRLQRRRMAVAARAAFGLAGRVLIRGRGRG
jgi:N-acetylglucosaminyl-diphospho-decaprenol L-rhamnosyltransferase